MVELVMAPLQGKLKTKQCFEKLRLLRVILTISMNSILYSFYNGNEYVPSAIIVLVHIKNSHIPRGLLKLQIRRVPLIQCKVHKENAILYG